MSHDLVHCQGLELDVEIGFHDVERHVRQTIRVDLAMETDFGAGPARDDHAGLVDYYEIASHLTRHVAGRRYDLIEALAVDLARQVLAHSLAHAVRVRITKHPLDMPRVASVGVECVRSRADFAPEAPPRSRT